MKEEYQVKTALKELKKAGHRKKAHQEEAAGETVTVETLEGEQEQHHYHQCQLFQGAATKIIYNQWRSGRPLCNTALDFFFTVAEGVTQLVTVKAYHVRAHLCDMIRKMALSASRNLSLVFDSKKLPAEA